MDPCRIKFVRYAIFTRCLREVLAPTTNATPSIPNYKIFCLFRYTMYLDVLYLDINDSVSKSHYNYKTNLDITIL
jgi:hypothetical protein